MNKHQSKFALFLFFMVFFSLFMSKPLLPDSPIQWRIGEELTYKVKWSFLRLGTLRVQLVDTIKIDTQPVFHAQISIDSNPLLFFVNYHSIFHSYFDKDLNIYLFHYHEKENGVTYRAEYRFNYKDSLVYIGLTDTTDTLNTIRREMAFHHQVLDGSSLLYYAREHAWKTTTDTVYYLTDEAQDQAIIHFYGLDQKIKIKALDKSCLLYTSPSPRD